MTLKSARSFALTPAVIAFIAAPHLRRRSIGAFRALQKVDPVHRSPLGLVILSRHADVAAVLRSPSFGSDESKADPALLRLGALDRVFGAKQQSPVRGKFLELFHLLMLFRDPPDHTRLRSLVAKAFTPKRVQALEPRVTQISEEILEDLERRQRFDFMPEFAYRFPARVICELLGIPIGDVETFTTNAPALAIALDPAPMRTTEGIEQANAAAVLLTERLRELINERRRAPHDDLLSALVAADEDGDRLSEDELIATVLLLIIAGHETTANVLGNALVRLAGAPSLRDELVGADAGQLKPIVDEFLRLDGPIQMVERIALADYQLGDLTIRRGQIVIPLVGAANRDPHVFDEPAFFRADRAPNPHLAFGAGHHHCIGAPLARLELGIALQALARRGPLTPIGPPRYRDSFTIRGIAALPVRIDRPTTAQTRRRRSRGEEYHRRP